jgi:hypothetical protein
LEEKNIVEATRASSTFFEVKIGAVYESMSHMMIDCFPLVHMCCLIHIFSNLMKKVQTNANASFPTVSFFCCFSFPTFFPPDFIRRKTFRVKYRLGQTLLNFSSTK